MKAWLIQIDAYDGATATTLRMASHDDDRLCHLNGQTWWPVIVKLPTLRYDFFDGSFDSGSITSPSGTLEANIEAIPSLPRLAIHDARIRIWGGELGAAFAGFLLTFDGRVKEQPSVDGGTMSISFGTDDSWLDQPLLATYAGTGAAEGGTDLEGQVKALALGAPRFVPATLIDAVDNIYQLSGYGALNAVETAFERLNRFGAPAGNATSFAALKAGAVTRGQWATCLAQGFVKFGAPPEGLLSFHLQGDATGGWSRLPGDIIRRIATIAGGASRLSSDDVAAINTARPWPLSIVVNAQTTARDLIQRIAMSVNAVAYVDWLGMLRLSAIGIGAASMTVAADGSSLPPVADVQQVEISAPFWKIAQGAAVTWQVHGLNEIAFSAPLNPRGPYDPDETYREGDMVTLPNGSQWLFIGATPAKGSAPADSNPNWFRLSDAITAANVTYDDGQTVEELKPAEPGATDGMNPAEKDEFEQLKEDQAAAEVAMGQAQDQIDDLIATYGSTASAAASASAAQTSAAAAQGYASTASTASGNAQTARDQANTASSAAQAARTASETARDNATTAATNANTAKVAAEAARDTANTAATNANSARTQAETAFANSTTARDAAQAAQTAAETARSQAQTYASNANGSATAAAGSASSAQTSATNAGNSATAAAASVVAATSAYTNAIDAINRAPILPSGFGEGGKYWTLSRNGAPSAMPDPTAAVVGSDPDLGPTLGFSWGAQGSNILTKGIVELVAGRVYEVQARMKVTASDGSISFSTVAVPMLADFTGAPTSGNFISGGAATITTTGTVTTLSGKFSLTAGTGIMTLPAGSAFARFGVRMTTAETTTLPTFLFGSITIRDVTEREAATVYADAAATSASAAATSATAAGTSATAAQTSATTANTQAGNASTSAGQASTSATNAAGSASAAQTSATNAANSATAAGTSATAASNSASTAATKASDAEQSASASASSATLAGTKAGEAATSATQASTSATTAQGHAATASTQATNAANSATAAGGSAIAASNSASTAATQATNAGNSATAAQASALYAESSATLNLVKKGNFSDNGIGLWAGNSTPTAFLETAPDGQTRVLRSTNRDTWETAFTPVTATNARTLRLTGYVRNPGSFALLFGVNWQNAAGTDAWVQTQIAAASATSWAAFSVTITLPATAVRLRPILTSNGTAGAAGHDYRVSSLRIEDITESTAAAGSATAASTSASNASTSATNAGNSATAAQSSATAANTSAGNASTSATQASSSASAAGTSASNAATSATNAANSATSAGNSATAASGSASNASTSATAAGNSASAAAVSAVSAASSYTSAVSALNNGPLLPTQLTDANYWTVSRNGVPDSMTPATLSVVNDSLLGPSAEFTTWTTAGAQILTRGAAPIVAGRIYEVSVLFRGTAGDGNIQFSVIGCPMDGAYAGLPSANSFVSGGVVTMTGTTSMLATAMFSTVAVAGVSAIDAATKFLRVGLRLGTAETGLIIRIAQIKIVDVTEREAAKSSASAAATSASSAGTSATNAGTSASAAQGSATTAATQAANALNSANSAATSASSASTAATNAGTYATSANSSDVSAALTAAAMMPADFQQDGKFWATGYIGAPSALAPIATNSVYSFVSVSGVGRVIQIVSQASFTYVCTIGAVAMQPGRKYRVTGRARHTQAASLSVSLFAVMLGSDYSAGSNREHLQTLSVQNQWVDYSLDVDADTFIAAGRTYLRALFRLSANAGHIIQIAGIKVEDITSQDAAAGSAAAAASSASLASASQTAAGNSASSASTSATNAATSATNASNSAGAASTSASSASTSASNAAGSANTASTQATNASNSATAANNSASAAAGSASAASTSATNAGNSASAASASQLSASSSAAAALNTLYVSAPLLTSTFEEGLKHWISTRSGSPTSPGGDLSPTNTSWVADADMGNALELSWFATAGANLASRGVLAIAPGRIYEIFTRFKITASDGSVSLNLAVAPMFGDFTGNPANNAFVGATSSQSFTGTGTVQTMSRLFSLTAGTGIATITAGTTFIRPLLRLNGNESGLVLRVGELRITDVTEREAAATSASAAATSASNASTSATNAANSATSATNSANTANTRANDASSSATAAATSASNASSSSSAAGSSATAAANSATAAAGSATNANSSASTASGHASSASGSASAAAASATQAATYAGNANTSATNASNSAVVATNAASAAQTSMTLTASIAAGGMNPNPAFADWPSGNVYPGSWTNYGTIDGLGKMTNISPYGPYAVSMLANPGNTQSGLQTGVIGGTDNGRISNGQWLVIEADVRFYSAVTAGAGVTVVVRNSSGAGIANLNLHFYSDPDTSGAVNATGIDATRIKSFRKMVQVQAAGAFSFIVYALNRWSGFAGYNTGVTTGIEWFRVNLRPASDQEIAAQKATGDIATLNASVSSQASALATLQGSYASLSSTVTAQGASITSQASAIASVQGNVTTLFARASMTIAAGNVITGWESSTNGSVSSFKIRSDILEIVPSSSSGERTSFSNGAWKGYDSAGTKRFQLGNLAA